MVAIVGQFSHSSGRAGFDPVNFFSYFTILSNIFVAAVLAVAAVVALTGKQPGKMLECSRGAATVYMVTTGILFALLLAKYDVGVTLPWVNHILHQAIPVFALLDWLLMPPARRLSPRIWFSWLIFPLAYAPYTLIRGSAVNWYPYPFLDPNWNNAGYGRVFAYCAGITVFMVGLAAAIGWAGNYLHLKTKSAKR